jgi:signal peptidase II
MKTKIFATAMAAVLIALDQLIKFWAAAVLQPVYTISVLPGFFRLTYVENRGAAVGLFQGNARLLSIITGVVMLGVLLYVYIGKHRDRLFVYTLMLVIAGGVGNFIDRVRQGFVVDYLDFSALFGFPVFNLADCCVVVGAMLMIFYALREEYREKKRGKQ